MILSETTAGAGRQRCKRVASYIADAMQECDDGKASLHATEWQGPNLQAGDSPAKPQDHDSKHEQGGVVSSKVVGLHASGSQHKNHQEGPPPERCVTSMTGSC